MRSFFYSLLGSFLTPGGLLVMGALDSSLIFFLPLGIDFAVIVLAARKPDLFWLYALLATAGSLAGAAATFWIGRKIGEHGLSKLIKPAQLKRVQQRVGPERRRQRGGARIIPPPFPFTAFVLTSGACRVRTGTFFSTLAGVRVARFAIEAGLAARYGRRPDRPRHRGDSGLRCDGVAKYAPTFLRCGIAAGRRLRRSPTATPDPEGT